VFVLVNTLLIRTSLYSCFFSFFFTI
jgi:hypothetical protein